MNPARFLQFALLIGSLAILTGCESELASLSDDELQDKVFECNRAIDQSPGFAIACDNFRRECQRRRDEGNYVC